MSVPLSMLGIMVDREELAWAAGFYDGEGCTWAREAGRRKNRGGFIGMCVQQADRRPLDRFHAAVLGIGTIKGPYSHASAKGRQPLHSWSVTNWRDANTVIGLLWPLLSKPKREQILRSVAIQRSDPGWGRKTGRPFKGTGPRPLSGPPSLGDVEPTEIEESLPQQDMLPHVSGSALDGQGDALVG